MKACVVQRVQEENPMGLVMSHGREPASVEIPGEDKDRSKAGHCIQERTEITQSDTLSLTAADGTEGKDDSSAPV